MPHNSSVSVLLGSALRAAQSITVLTGAGVSAASGLPTFRDAMTGLWSRYRPEDLASAEAFQRNPKLVWDWYAMRRAQAQAANPNAAHDALAEMQRRIPKFALLTQNVDGLHQRAGSVAVIEMHGSLFRVKCVNDGMVYTKWSEGEGVPQCPQCGDLLRPDVVWFGETLAPENLRTASEAATQCDVFLSIGTSGSVYPVAALIELAARQGASCAVINKKAVANSHQSVLFIPGKSEEIIPALVRAAWPEAMTKA